MRHPGNGLFNWIVSIRNMENFVIIDSLPGELSPDHGSKLIPTSLLRETVL